MEYLLAMLLIEWIPILSDQLNKNQVYLQR